MMIRQWSKLCTTTLARRTNSFNTSSMVGVDPVIMVAQPTTFSLTREMSFLSKRRKEMQQLAERANNSFNKDKTSITKKADRGESSTPYNDNKKKFKSTRDSSVEKERGGKKEHDNESKRKHSKKDAKDSKATATITPKENKKKHKFPKEKPVKESNDMHDMDEMDLKNNANLFNMMGLQDEVDLDTQINNLEDVQAPEQQPSSPPPPPADSPDIMSIINPSKYTNVQHFMDLLDEDERKKISEQKRVVKSPRNARLLRISILGNPNAGKSTLLNQIVKTKVSAVSPKRQTTREKAIAVHNMQEAQFVFYDTPGVISPKYRQSAASVQEVTDPLMKEAMGTLEKADVVLLMIDATKSLEEIEHLIKTIAHYHKVIQKATESQVDEENKKKKKSKSFKPVDGLEEPEPPKRFQCIAVLNKKDLLSEDEALADLEYALLETKVFVDVVPISALQNEGIDRLQRILYSMAYSHNWLYDTVIPELTIKQRIAEIVREKMYERLNKEVPYQVELYVAKAELTKPVPDGVLIDVDFRVKTIGQRRIVIGSLPYIHKNALSELKQLFNTQKLHLSFEVNILPDHAGLKHLSSEEKQKRMKLLTQSHRKSYHANLSQIKQNKTEKREENVEGKKHKADIWK